jgi:hypothetical protein
VQAAGQAGPALVHRAPVVADDHVARARGKEQFEHGSARGARSGHRDPHRPQLLANHPQRIGQGGEHHDRGAVLVVVEDGDVEQVAQPALHLEAARGADVLQVDAAEGRRDDLHGPDDLVGVLGV